MEQTAETSNMTIEEGQPRKQLSIASGQSRSSTPDDDIDLDLVQQYIRLGLAAAAQENLQGYNRAEHFLRLALEKPQMLEHPTGVASRSEVELSLALTLIELDKLDESRAICERLVEAGCQSGVNSDQNVSAMSTLAQIEFREGRLTEAELWCRKAMKGQRSLHGKTLLYFQDTSLMADILKARGKLHESEAYAGLLPGWFERRQNKSRAGDHSQTKGILEPSKSSAVPTMLQQIQKSNPGAEASYQLRAVSTGPSKGLSATATRPEGEGEPRRGTSPQVTMTMEAATERLMKALRIRTVPQLCCFMTPIHWASVLGDEETLAQLLKGEYHVDTADYGFAWTPLHVVAAIGSERMANSLLDHGADAQRKDRNGYTPLHHAAHTGRVSVARALVRRGASIDARNTPLDTPLHLAARAHNDPLVDWLLTEGADVNAINLGRRTPLHLAAGQGFDSTVKLLLKRGADRSIKNDIGKTALDVAKKANHGARGAIIIKMLQV